MRAGAVAENAVETLLLATNAIPRPLIETMLGLLLARVVMAATRNHVFDVLKAAGPLATAGVARRCRTDLRATEGLLEALAGARYVRRGVDGRWRNTAAATRWLTSGAADSVRDNVLFRYHEWDLIGRFEQYLATGEPLAIHEDDGAEDGFWPRYVRGMQALARIVAGEVAARTPVPAGATRLLDIGGAHGEYALALCRLHPALHADVFDLEPALDVARELLGGSDLVARITLVPGDLRGADFGVATYDVCLLVNVLHHFLPAQNEATLRAVARALRPGGVVVIGDAIRERTGRPPAQMAALLNFYFQVTSGALVPTLADVHRWLDAARLVPRRSVGLRRAPGAKLVIARKNA